MTATFFNAKYLKKTLVEGTRVMLSGEVGFFKGTMQLTHPAFLILDSPDGPNRGGTKSLKKMVEATQDAGGELDLSVFERDFFPIYPASAKLQSWDIYACVRQVLAVLDPVADPLPESILRERNLISEDEALRAVHLAENDVERRAGRGAAAVRRGRRAAVGAGRAALRRALRDGSAGGAARWTGCVPALLERLPFELTGGQREVLSVITDGAGGVAADEPHAAG